MAKKNPYVFTIGFDETDLVHVRAAEILNGTKKKARLIATAILSYVDGVDSERSAVFYVESLQPLLEKLIQKELEKVMNGHSTTKERQSIDSVLDLSPAKVNENIVVIFSAGSAVEMPWLSNCKALVHGYLCGQAGASALLKVITGEVNPSGKLAESYPLKYEDVSSAPYFPGKERTVEYREGLFVGYRYYETAEVPVLFPFGYGLSYTTLEYSNLIVTPEKAEFTLTNTGTVDGEEIAQLYIRSASGSVFRPAKELKGFQKVFLKAGESRRVTIEFDSYTFRYFNVKTNQFETEGGSYEVLIGASVADIRLSDQVQIAGTDAVSPYKPAVLPDYYKGSVKDIPDAEFEKLLGHKIPDGHWSGILDMNDAICQMYYAKSGIARLVYKSMTNMLKKAEAKGTPDLNLLFIYNMPFRGIAKMTGGMVSMKMAEGILMAVNGHFFRGLGKLIGGFSQARSRKKKAGQMN